MDRKLLILGAGGHGKVCKEVAEAMNVFDQIDFLDDNSELAIGKVGDMPIFAKSYSGPLLTMKNSPLMTVLWNWKCFILMTLSKVCLTFWKARKNIASLMV